MARWVRVWVLVAAATGCHHRPGAVAPRPAAPSVAPVAIDLKPTEPIIPDLSAKSLPSVPPRTPSGPVGRTFRRLTESDCLLLAAANTGSANRLDEENRVPPTGGDCDTAGDRLKQTVRYYTALELRNQSAAAALDRFFQLTDAEARSDLLRQAFPVIDPVLAKAKAAQAQGVRFPLEVGDLERQRSQLVSQLEQAELGSRLIDLDLKRRVGLPYAPADDRLWPVGGFAIDPAAIDPETAVTAAVADRPELRGLRALHAGLTPDTLPDIRDFLGAGKGEPGVLTPGVLARILLRRKGPDPAAVAELDVRRKQLHDLLIERERQISDEARAAALMLNAQTTRAALARDRLAGWDAKLAEAVKKRDANQPGADFLEPQVRMEWLKAKAEVAMEVAAWHQTRVRLKAAQGWLAWEAVGTDGSSPRR